MTHLSPRERQVLTRYAEGDDLPEIARSLYVSPSTVKTYARNLAEKLGARNRAHAVAIAFRTGLLDGTAEAAATERNLLADQLDDIARTLRTTTRKELA